MSMSLHRCITEHTNPGARPCHAAGGFAWRRVTWHAGYPAHRVWQEMCWGMTDDEDATFGHVVQVKSFTPDVRLREATVRRPESRCISTSDDHAVVRGSIDIIG